MHFESLNIHGFGCLRTDITFAPNKLNLIIANNEMGKTTLVSALLAAFYGIESDERKKKTVLPKLKNVLPWTRPEEFGLTLDFTADKVQWRIERDFNNGSVKLIDRVSGRDLSDNYHKGRGRYRIGEELIGLSCEDFLKSFYLQQEEAYEVYDTGGLTAHVQRIATAREGDVTSEHAIERLQNVLREYPLSDIRGARNIENTLKRLNSERENTLNEIDSLKRQRDEIEPLCIRLAEIERELIRLNSRRDRDILNAEREEAREISELLETQEKIREEHNQLSAAAEELEIFSSFPADKWGRLNTISGRFDELTAALERQHIDIKTNADEPLSEIEEKLIEFEALQPVTKDDLQQFGTVVSRLEDRQERLGKIEKQRNELEEKLQTEGFNRERYGGLKKSFSALDNERRRSISDFNAINREVEDSYRDLQGEREKLQKNLAASLKVYKQRRLVMMLLLLAAVAGSITGAALLMSAETFGWIFVGVSFIPAVTGIVVLISVLQFKSKNLNTLKDELVFADRRESEVQSKLEATSEEIDTLARKLDLSDGSELLSEFSAFEKMEELSKPLYELERGLSQACEETGDALKLITPYFDRAGRSLSENGDVISTTRELLNDYHKVLGLNERRQLHVSRKEQMNNDLTILENNLETNGKEINEIMQLGNVETNLPLEEMVSAFKESLEKHREYISIVEDRLPPIKRELLPETELASKNDRLKELKRRGVASETAERSEHSKEYDRERAEDATRQMDGLNEERIEINRNISAVIDLYQRRYPELSLQLDKLEESLKQAEAFKTEVDIAINILQEISREVYRSWAHSLSDEAAPLLNALNPNYGKMKFSEDLTFTIIDVKKGKILTSEEVGSIVSTGARYEIYLAARLGIARYLSRSAKDRLPIVLDEPLAMADDERFLSGMSFFLETLSRHHQVLIVSCHAMRHQWLEEGIQEHFSDRVHNTTLLSRVC